MRKGEDIRETVSEILNGSGTCSDTFLSVLGAEALVTPTDWEGKNLGYFRKNETEIRNGKTK